MKQSVTSIFVALALVACASAQTTQPADAAFLDKLLADLDAKASKVTDLSAKFEQQKKTPLLKKPLVSSGSVRAKGATMLWQTEKPEPTVMRIDDKTLELLYVNQKVLEIYPIEGKLASLASSPVPRIATLREYFDIKADNAPISEDTITLRLTPRDETLKQYADEVRVGIDIHKGIARSFTMIDPDGEQTVITFSDYTINGGLTDDQLKLTVPPDTKTVRPADPTQPRQGS